MATYRVEGRAVIIGVAVALMLSVLPVQAVTKTWNGSTSTNWANGANWTGGLPGAGDDVAIPSGTTYAPSIPAGTNPASGAYASFSISNGVTVTCLGDPTATNAASGGTAGNPHGIGVTIFCINAVINGTLSAYAQGFRMNTGPGYSGGGSAHGGKGNGDPYSTTYGSVPQPTALGSGGNGSSDRVGGGAIRLEVSDTLLLNGAINASAPSTDRSGSGGSIWLTASNFTGSGVIKAEGGTSAYNSSGGGGRIAIVYTNSTFNGSVSIAGGGGTPLAEPGTLWEPARFSGRVGTPAVPVAMLITNSYQYYFPAATATNYWNLTISNAWFEAHQGSLQIPDLVLTNGIFAFDRYATGQKGNSDMNYLDITNRIRLTGASIGYLCAQTYTLPGGLYVGPGSVLETRGDTNAINAASGGTLGNSHGIGVTIYCPTATIDGKISALGEGFGQLQGPGPGTDSLGGTHGGKGSWATTVATYGSMTNPTALGSGGKGDPSRWGGGAIRLAVSDTLSLNGTIDASAPDTPRAGSGGSIWLTVSNLTGSGTIKAEGGTSANGSSGGGGRVALYYTNSTFSGSVSVSGGRGTVFAEPGTFWEPKLFAGKAGALQNPQAIVITNSYLYCFPDATLTNYWNLTVSNAWFEPHQGSLQICDLLLTNAVFRFDRYVAGQPTVVDMNYFEVTNGVRVTGSSSLYLPPRTYVIGGALYVGPTINAIIYAVGDTNAINPSSGGTTGIHHGVGVTIRCASAAIDGWMSADALGFVASTGPGSPGINAGGGGYGGQGGALGVAYGALSRPTALGSGGASVASGRDGGGAIRLVANGTVTINGQVTATSPDSGDFTGAGGSIWITADTLAGSGAIAAKGGNCSKNSFTGAGGRIALFATNIAFAGTVSVAGGTVNGAAAPGKTGTLFRCTSPVADCGDTNSPGVQLTSDFSVNSNGVYVTRQVARWYKSFQWTDDSRDPANNALNNVAQYAVSGLPVNTIYTIYVNGAIVCSRTNSGVSGILNLGNVSLLPSATVLLQVLPRGTIITVY